MTRTDVIAHEPLLDDRHYHHTLSEFWTETHALLVFLRHFGSTFAYDQADVLNQASAELQAANIRPVMIGAGTPRAAAYFRRVSNTQVPVLADPTLTIYRRLGLRQVSLASTTPRVLRRWLSSNHTRISLADKDHGRQLGGSFLIDTTGTVLAERRSTRPSEVADIAAIHRYLAISRTRSESAEHPAVSDRRVPRASGQRVV
ncbi:AhpC/TSA family protein [Nocardia iowensis]|uniref:Redoxin domain-containing protein n=1 Tax=Nocardia iowensis TaxID=204891 RepID=A0ABX8RYK5_NOCIO|nr:AhpC/TSA family protein [Nocardia iowensis]QXN94062.1 redoxin domain-containing protein [Nocardia iowensis]